MPKNDSEGLLQHAQPLLRGINLAKFLCDSCPFNELTKGGDGRDGSCSGLPPSGENAISSVADDVVDHQLLGQPGRL